MPPRVILGLQARSIRLQAKVLAEDDKEVAGRLTGGPAGWMLNSAAQ